MLYVDAYIIQLIILNVHNRKCTGNAYIKDKSMSAAPLIADADICIIKLLSCVYAR